MFTGKMTAEMVMATITIITTGWAKKVVHFSTHHIFGTVWDEMKLILLHCQENLCDECNYKFLANLLHILCEICK